MAMQDDMLATRREEFEDSIVECKSWDGFVEALDNKKMVQTPWYAVFSAILGLLPVPCRPSSHTVLVIMFGGF